MKRSIHRLWQWRTSAVIAVIVLIAGCESLPKDAFRLSETALEVRQIQTREFDSVSEAQILAASMGLLQDLGYTIDEIDKDLGVLSASKRADATNPNQLIGRAALDVVSCVFTFLIACDNENYKKSDDFQDIRMTIVVLPSPQNVSSNAVRVTMQRVVWDRDGRISSQTTIDDAEVYQAFFTKLDKSVFLEKERT